LKIFQLQHVFERNSLIIMGGGVQPAHHDSNSSQIDFVVNCPLCSFACEECICSFLVFTVSPECVVCGLRLLADPLFIPKMGFDEFR